jgi:hypothetical protein
MPASLPLPLSFFILFDMEKLYPKELGMAGACSFKNDSYLTMSFGSHQNTEFWMEFCMAGHW